MMPSIFELLAAHQAVRNAIDLIAALRDGLVEEGFTRAQANKLAVHLVTTPSTTNTN